MRFYLASLLLVLLYSCGEKSSPTELVVNKNIEFSDYEPYINQVDNKKDDNELSWVNKDYPLKLTLYSDKTFSWTLRVLGDGQGEWKYSSGKLQLKSRTHLFDMEIDLAKMSENEFIFHFTDRFGTKVLPVIFKNSNE